ncbi:rab geranylgeranyltransferase [Suillus plorans]|uniref:Geranylgeranyl transferase type-2 subunit beta n=1 Tax=Suillus plorans TaxID=116603 RepID=A0A9P7DAL8_9AGAM|nr:rab geranylgeranyltransferase [Suillus plorans]KAG1785639.1 rab geranylgeranyltransferase [Suillus plorans]
MSTSLLVPQHVAYIRALSGDSKHELSYDLSAHLRMNAVYWSLTALLIMGHGDALDRDEMIDFVMSCWDEEADILSLQQPSGSFAGDAFGETDTRFLYCAVNALSLLGKLDKLDVEKTVAYIRRCSNFDGGFGAVAGAESHASRVFVCIASLAILDRLDEVNQPTLFWWLSERQLPNGGLNGRPEKLEDVCYSFWVLSALSILNKLTWIDSSKLEAFILSAQNTESGGISDRPGNMPDVFHTIFGLAGLSLLGYPTLVDLDPVYCMPTSIIENMGLRKGWKALQRRTS